MTKSISIFMLLLFCTLFTGCVSSLINSPLSMEKEKKRLGTSFYEKALALEQQNELVEARKNYQLAFTADPSKKEAQQGIINMNHQLQSLADQYYGKGLLLRKKGKYEQARRYLMISLRLWPDHAEALQALISDQMLNIQKFVWHTITKGETLSKISKTYYGDFDQSSIIAQVNNIADAAAIRLGMKIKLPELSDHPFVNQTVENTLEQLTDDEIQNEKKTDPLMMYKSLGMEFFKEQEFDNAVTEFKKVLSADPKDKDAMEYISNAYYEMGSASYTQKKFLVAIEHFQNALAFNKNCSQCIHKIAQSRNNYTESHYKAGMKFFDAQDLNNAILEWDLVQQIDPEYKKVTELLDKAKTIQKNIDALKKSE